MKQFLFVIMMMVAGFAVKAQTTTIVNNTNCKFKIVHQSFTATLRTVWYPGSV